MRHIFIDHSNMWGGGRAASKIEEPSLPEAKSRISVKNLGRILGGSKQGTTTKVVSGGVPPGLEGLWHQYEQHGYNTQRLFRDKHWRERGVDHSIIGHMWRIVALHRGNPVEIVLASGDGKQNDFGTSFKEVLDEVLKREGHDAVRVTLASFDWETPRDAPFRSPTSKRMRKLVEESERGKFINLMDHYSDLVYHERST